MPVGIATGKIPDGCYVWDGWREVCKEWHPPKELQWWQYMNAASISVVIAAITLAIIAVMFAYAILTSNSGSSE